MDPLVVMDYVDDMNPVLMFLGFVLFFSSLLFQFEAVSKVVGIEFSLIEGLVFMAYGVLTFVGGFLQGEAEYLEYFVDISALVGLLLPLGKYLVPSILSQSLWFRISLVALFFLAVPSTFATWFTRESIYEDDNHDLEEPYDNNY